MQAPPLPQLTSLRFFAAGAIVLLHMQAPVFGIPGDARLGLGVGFFFVLSGFILTYVYRDFTGHSIRAFYVARLGRLWPVHFVTFLAAAIVLQPNLLLSGPHIATIPYNLTLTQAWLPLNGLVFSWNAVSWSVSAEFWFYLLFPLLVIGRQFWPVALITIAATVAFVIAVELGGIYKPPQFLAFSPLHAVQQHPAARMVEFVCGVGAGRLFNRGFRIKLPPNFLEIASLVALAVFAATSTGLMLILSTSGVPAIGIWYSQSGGAVLFALAIFIFANGGGFITKILSHKTLVTLGEISFSTYMVHQLVIRFAIDHGWLNTSGPPMVFLLLFLIYAGSWALWFFVERPCRKWIIGTIKPSGIALKT